MSDDPEIKVPIHTLVTGFGPFPGVTDNPSAKLALSFDGAAEGAMRGCVVPTSWSGAFPGLAQGLEGAQPRVLIMLGVDTKATAPRLERWAHNRRSDRADCDGVTGPAGALVKGGAKRIETTLPFGHLGPESVSKDAGAYLCNALFYWTMAFLKHIPYRGFIHVPPDDLEGSRAFIESVLAAAHD